MSVSGRSEVRPPTPRFVLRPGHCRAGLFFSCVTSICGDCRLTISQAATVGRSTSVNQPSAKQVSSAIRSYYRAASIEPSLEGFLVAGMPAASAGGVVTPIQLAEASAMAGAGTTIVGGAGRPRLRFLAARQCIGVDRVTPGASSACLDQRVQAEPARCRTGR
jgi:hypothetical protein